MDFFRWSSVYLRLRVHFYSYELTQRLCFIFYIFIHTNSRVNRTAGEISIFGICSFTAPVLLFFTDSFSLLNQRIRELPKRSTSSPVLSIISLIILHHSSSNEWPLNSWIHIFWILHLLYKIYRRLIHYVTVLSKVNALRVYDIWVNISLADNSTLHIRPEWYFSSIFWEKVVLNVTKYGTEVKNNNIRRFKTNLLIYCLILMAWS